MRQGRDVGKKRREEGRMGKRRERYGGGRDRENDKGKCEMLKAIRILGEVLRNEIALGGELVGEGGEHRR